MLIPAISHEDPHEITISPKTGNVYVASADNTVSVISKSNQVIATIPVGGFPGGIAVNPSTGNVYVVNRDDGTVSVISPSNKVIATIPVGGDDTEGGGVLKTTSKSIQLQ